MSDLRSNGSVEVEELGLHAVEHGRDVELSIPARGLVEGKGNVIAELIAVDGSKVHATADVDFALNKDEHKTLSVRLALPEDVQQPLRAADGGSRVSLYYQPDQEASAASTTLVVTGG